jgi:hypothetical protein
LLEYSKKLAGAPGVGDCVAWLVQPALLAATAATATIMIVKCILVLAPIISLPQ